MLDTASSSMFFLDSRSTKSLAYSTVMASRNLNTRISSKYSLEEEEEKEEEEEEEEKEEDSLELNCHLE